MSVNLPNFNVKQSMLTHHAIDTGHLLFLNVVRSQMLLKRLKEAYRRPLTVRKTPIIGSSGD
jgi:hypothetical protein